MTKPTEQYRLPHPERWFIAYKGKSTSIANLLDRLEALEKKMRLIQLFVEAQDKEEK